MAGAVGGVDRKCLFVIASSAKQTARRAVHLAQQVEI
jgi:hypothetical protein